MDKTVFPALERSIPWKKRSSWPGNTSVQKWRAWKRRFHAFPPSLA